MIQTQTILKVADNSGAKTVKCIKVLNKSKIAHVGDTILVSVQTVKSGVRNTGSNNSNKNMSSGGNKRTTGVKKGQIFKALVIRTKKSISNRPNGYHLSFETNDVVLFSKTEGKVSLQGSRIFGPITRELRTNNYMSIISQAKRMI